MANIFKIKRRTSDGTAPTSANLENGELAYNEVSDIMYYAKADGSVIKIAGSGAYTTVDTSQTISAAKTFEASVDLGSSAVTVTQNLTSNDTSVATTEFVKNAVAVLDGSTF
jgi:hypothetical protein